MSQALNQLTDETRALLMKMVRDAPLSKAIDLAVGLIGYNLEAPAKQLVPLMSEFRQSIPRASWPGSNAINWKQITSLGSPKLSSAEKASGALFTTTKSDKAGSYKVMALRGQVTREAVAASLGFDDALAKETMNTLANAMKLEEQYILGGNITALATPAAPTLLEVNAVGTIGAVNNFVRIAALTLPAANRLSIDRPADVATLDAFLAGRAVTGIDGSTDGVTVAGAEATTGAFTGVDNGLRISWPAVPGAAAYAVYVGATTGAANLKCEAIVTQTLVTLTSLAGTGSVASALTGTSADALSYDGIVAQLVAAASGAYKKNLNGILSASGGEVTQVQDMFQSIWDVSKIADFRLLVGGIESRLLTRKGIASDSLRFNVTNDAAGRMEFTQGAHIGSIMNQVKGTKVPVETLPWLPGGMIIALATDIPFNDANVTSPFDMAMGYDWERWDYASTATTGPIFEFDTRCWGVLRGLFTGGCGIIYNIHKG